MNEEQRAEIIKKIQKLRLMDDFFMTRFFEDNIECVQLVLNIILNRKDLTVEKVVVQKDIKSLVGHGVCLDVLAIDRQGKYYNIEVQKATDGADFRRARYNGSLLDTVILGKGEKYQDLPDTYVIFITEKDVIGCGLSVYEIEKVIKQNQQKIEDGTHVLYVNGTYRGDDDIGKLMEDFSNSNYATMNYKQLQQRSKYLKEEKGERNMCAFTEEVLAMGRAEGEARGRAEGEARGRAEGEARGEARGRIEERIAAIKRIMKKLSMGRDEAMDFLEIPVAERGQILSDL